MSYKLCKKCGVLKEYSEYYVDKARGYGVSCNCKECTRAYNRKHSMLDDSVAKRRARSLKNRDNIEMRKKAKDNSKKHYNSLLGRAKSLLKTTTRRSSKFGKVDNPVDIEFILERLKLGKCEVTGIAFDYDNKFNTCKNPLSPSIDRIDSTKGYSKDNARIVLWQYNLMRGELTDDQLFDIFGEYFKSKVLDDDD